MRSNHTLGATRLMTARLRTRPANVGLRRLRRLTGLRRWPGLRGEDDENGGRAIVLYDTALTEAAYGRPVSVTPWLERPDTPIRDVVTARNGVPLTMTLYDTALARSAYGQAPQLGDLFNDIVGAIVPGWDDRPQWMKDIRVKPNAPQIIQQAAKVVSPEKVGNVIDQAQKYGFNIFYRTPAGEVPVTGSTAAGLYRNYPVVAKARETLAAVPPMVWLGGGAVLLLLLMRR